MGGGGGGWLAVGGAGPAAAPALASGTGSSRSLQKGPGGFPPKDSNFSVVAPPVTGVHCPVLELPSGSALLRYWEPLCKQICKELESRTNAVFLRTDYIPLLTLTDMWSYLASSFGSPHGLRAFYFADPGMRVQIIIFA